MYDIANSSRSNYGGTIHANTSHPCTTADRSASPIDEDEDDLDLDWVIANVKSPFRLVPYTWDQLQEIAKEEDFSKLSRSNMQQYSYKHSVRELRSRWKSIDDYILCSKFNFEPLKEEDTGRLCAYPSLSEFQETQMSVTAVSPNDFPYFVANNVEHFVLWKLGGPCTEHDVARAMNNIQCQRANQMIDFIYWTDPEELKSSPDIQRVQILCLRRTPKTSNNRH
jgi:hypothetical protein